jgi:maltooligosyltrehalose synthase
VSGERKDNIYAFRRTTDEQEAIIICGRLFTSVYSEFNLDKNAWKNTYIKVKSAGNYLDFFSGENREIMTEQPVEDIFNPLPFSILIRN